jgi:branched-subunit amino acid aminotransferase/4-amino-4-deoxychorismate lyase
LHLADRETVLRWTPAGLQPAPAAAPGQLLVADSWLVEDGHVRAGGAHWARFVGSCEEAGAEPGELAAFRGAVAAALPASGRWFPRVELGAEGLALALRRAPPQSGEASVEVARPGDPRRLPGVKGPDLELLVELRAASPADEVLLCDDGGALREGALSSLLWWEDDVLCTTPDEHILPGVTRAVLLVLARHRGVEVRMRSPLPSELAGREVWLTSALHGIRAVSEWLAPAQPAGKALRAEAWRAALDGVDR